MQSLPEVLVGIRREILGRKSPQTMQDCGPNPELHDLALPIAAMRSGQLNGESGSPKCQNVDHHARSGIIDGENVLVFAQAKFMVLAAPRHATFPSALAP